MEKIKKRYKREKKLIMKEQRQYEKNIYGKY